MTATPPPAPAGPRRVGARGHPGDLRPLSRRMREAGRRPGAVAGVVVHETLDPEVVVVELALGGGDDPLPYVQVFRVRDGQIVSFRDYFGPRTAAALAAGLGAAPGG